MTASQAKERDIIAVAEVEQKFRDEWVIMEATHTDKFGFIRKGRIISHSPDKNAVVDAGLEFRQKNPKAHVCLFYAGPVIPEGVNVVL